MNAHTFARGVAVLLSFWVRAVTILLVGFCAARAVDVVPLDEWDNLDIGSVGLAGSGSYDSGTGEYTISGAGTDINSSSDRFHYAYRPLSGDGYIVARVKSIVNTNIAARSGVMIRETLAANSKHALMMVTPGDGAGMRYRSATGSSTTTVQVDGVVAPQWVKLERAGSVFSSYYSADGVAWTLVQRVGIGMASDVYVGLVAASRSTSVLTTAVVDEILVDNPPVLPWPWVENTVGTMTDAGVALFDGSYVLANLGADIASSADRMKFVSQPLIGDGTLTIKVASLTSGASNPRFGLMMRQDLQPGSANVLFGMTTPQDLVFQSRRFADGTTTSLAAALSVSYPTWLRLSRTGNTFTASYSLDGATWTERGVEIVEMSPVIEAGVAYSNRSNGIWGLGVGDEFALQTPLDADANGLPDAWEIANFGAVGADPTADPDADNLTNLQEWELGNDPNTLNALGQQPVIELLSGNTQEGPVGTELPQPLVVLVKDSLSGEPASGVPVTFRLIAGSVQLGSAAPAQSILIVLSDVNGLAQTTATFSTRAGAHTVQAVVGGGQQATGVEFTLKAFAGEAPDLLDASDIGNVASAGRTDYAGGSYALGSVNTRMISAVDTAHFASKPFEGDGSVIVRVESLDAATVNGYAGVMIRESLDDNAAYAAVTVTPGIGVVFNSRSVTGGAYMSNRKAGFTAPCWVALKRTGDTVLAFFSTDGEVWQTVSSPRTIDFNGSVRAGLMLVSYDTEYRNAVFTDLSFGSLAQAPWAAADIGTQNNAFLDEYGEDSILVRGGGTGIGSTSDKFRFVYQTIPFDGRIVAQLASQLEGQTTARSGVMLRASLEGNSKNILLATSPASGVSLLKRATDRAYTTTVTTRPGVAPLWLKLEKLGTQIDTFTSVDGVQWDLVSTQTMDFGAAALIGLAANSNVAAEHTQSLFENIQVDLFTGSRGWNASYYQGAAFDVLSTYRRDASIDFSWPAAVTPAGVPAGPYSARWEGDLVPAYSEIHTFTTLSQGGVTVTVNGQPVISNAVQHSLIENTGSVALSVGVPARIVVEYANADVAAAGRIQLRWSSASQPEEIVSTAALRPVDADIDRLPDAWEIANGLDPLDPTDAGLDLDNDGFTNLDEYQFGSDPHVAQDRVPGAVLLETWSGITGSEVQNLTGNAAFFGAPSAKQVITRLEAPVNRGSNFGTRIRGYIVPPVDGDYQFWIDADDRAELWMSPDDDPLTRVRIASATPYGHLADNTGYDSVFDKRSVTFTLTGGNHYYFEILHKENSGNDNVSVAWTRPGAEREVVSGEYLATYAPSATDADDDGLPDTWQTTHGLDATLAPTARGAYGDADGDGLINLFEYRVGTDPTVADTDGDGYTDHLETLVEADPLVATDLDLAPWTYGDVGAVYGPALAYHNAPGSYNLASAGWGMQVHFDDIFRFLHQEVAGDFELTTRIGRPDSSITGDGLITARASLDENAPALGLIIRPDGQHVAFLRSTSTSSIVTLAEFYPAHVSENASRDGYWVRLRREGNLFKYFYSADGQDWILFSLTSLALGDQPCFVGMAAADKGDVPAPRHFSGVNLDTAPAPVADPDLLPEGVTAEVIAVHNGSEGSTVSGQWVADGDGLVSQMFTGTVEYTFHVPHQGRGIYRLTFSARSPVNPTVSTLFPVTISVDGQFVGRVNLVLPAGEDGLAQILTPWLKAGTHTVRLHWDNTLSYRKLRINSLTVESLSGPDADDNGQADWIDDRMEALNTVDLDERDLYISPVSLDGKARFRDMLELLVEGEPLAVNPAPGYGWYADVPLSETNPVKVSAKFENTGLVENVHLSWASVNLLDLPEFLPDGHIQVRKDDAMRFTAYAPTHEKGGSATLTIVAPDSTETTHTIKVRKAGANYENSHDEDVRPPAHAFTQPGLYTITGVFTDKKTDVVTTSETFIVEVIEAAFASDPTVGLNNTPITWDNPLIPDNVLVEVDQGLVLSALGTLPAGGTRFSLSTVNLADSYIVARLGEDGPIFGHATVSSTRAATVSDTSMDLLQSYPDGSKLYGVPIIINNLTDDTRVEIEIFVAGVTFEDGTIFKVLTKADFDEYGRIYMKFIYPAGASVSICHRIHIYEGDTYLGQF